MHPKVHAGILSTNSESDEKDLAEQNIDKVDFVVCNLYPFKDTIAKINVTVEEAVEDIDIGGVTLLRAAAKNHARVCVLSDPQDYAEFLQGLDSGEITEKSRQLYALKSFEHTADYESTIADFFRKEYASPYQHLPLRYGVNPHQKKFVFSDASFHVSSFFCWRHFPPLDKCRMTLEPYLKEEY